MGPAAPWFQGKRFIFQVPRHLIGKEAAMCPSVLAVKPERYVLEFSRCVVWLSFVFMASQHHSCDDKARWSDANTLDSHSDGSEFKSGPSHPDLDSIWFSEITQSSYRVSWLRGKYYDSLPGTPGFESLYGHSDFGFQWRPESQQRRFVITGRGLFHHSSCFSVKLTFVSNGLTIDETSSLPHLRCGAAVAQWLGPSPPTTAIRVLYPASSLRDFRMWESRWTMPLAGGVFFFFLFRGTPVYPALVFQRHFILGSRFMSCPGMTGTYGSQLESPSLGECCLTLGSLLTRHNFFITSLCCHSLHKTWVIFYATGGHGGELVRLLTPPPPRSSRTGSESLPDFRHVAIVTNDAACRLVFSGVSHFPCPYILALLHAHFASPTSALKRNFERTLVRYAETRVQVPGLEAMIL
ncbi:hypothetical protein PR048_028746 [Dryococelus australis]|uniref:Uncharacterized protein n=1 Tax=Dryococelus australis TaxID=614101 RepID=A0ABQ9GBE1_9NEOP|nr:hypothetical protein PR048_028746 [Dryococelus australis]